MVKKINNLHSKHLDRMSKANKNISSHHTTPAWLDTP